MNFDQNKIKALSQMDKNEFADKLNEIALAFGIDKNTLTQAIGDTSFLQKKLANMSDADIRRLVASADADTLEKISKALGD